MSRQQQSTFRDRSDSAQSSRSSRTLDAPDHRPDQPRGYVGEKNMSGWTKEDREKERDRQWSSYAPLPAVKGTRGGIETPNRLRAQSPSLSNIQAESPGRFLQSLTPARIHSPPQTPATEQGGDSLSRHEESNRDERRDEDGREQRTYQEREQSTTESNGRATTVTATATATATVTGSPARRSRPNPNAPVFRSDATLKSCFDTCPLDARDRLKSMFMA